MAGRGANLSYADHVAKSNGTLIDYMVNVQGDNDIELDYLLNRLLPALPRRLRQSTTTDPAYHQTSQSELVHPKDHS